MEAVMNAHAVSYPSLQRRLIAERRSRALFARRARPPFLTRTTQHVGSARALSREIARAAVGLLGVALWALALLLLAA
jgi:hypothetical protein